MKKLLTFVLMVAIIGSVGFMIYYGGKKGVALFRLAKETEKAELAKRKSGLKLEQNRPAPDKEALAASEKETLTFFETLSDPEMNKIVGLNNNIQNQPVVPPGPSDYKPKKAVASPESKEKTNPSPDMASHASLLAPLGNRDSAYAALAKLSEEGKTAGKESSGEAAQDRGKKPPAVPEQADRPVLKSGKDDDKTYAVQISSFKELAPAQSLQAKLRGKGHSAYLLSVDVAGKGVLYRVYLGKYVGLDKAKAAVNQVKKEDDINGVVVLLQD